MYHDQSYECICYSRRETSRKLDYYRHCTRVCIFVPTFSPGVFQHVWTYTFRSFIKTTRTPIDFYRVLNETINSLEITDSGNVYSHYLRKFYRDDFPLPLMGIPFRNRMNEVTLFGPRNEFFQWKPPCMNGSVSPSWSSSLAVSSTGIRNSTVRQQQKYYAIPRCSFSFTSRHETCFFPRDRGCASHSIKRSFPAVGRAFNAREMQQTPNTRPKSER